MYVLLPARIEETSNVLPSRGIIQVHRPKNQAGEPVKSSCSVDIDKVREAFVWLKENNPLYAKSEWCPRSDETEEEAANEGFQANEASGERSASFAKDVENEGDILCSVDSPSKAGVCRMPEAEEDIICPDDSPTEGGHCGMSEAEDALMNIDSQEEPMASDIEETSTGMMCDETSRWELRATGDDEVVI